MLIRVLPALNHRDHWIGLCQRESPYCFIETPECLVDFQTGFLQITLLGSAIRDGREAVKFSLGSRQSLEPAWALIRACNWRLDKLIEGLESLDFRSNVRDNSLLGVHTDLSVRRYFARERHISSPSRLGLLAPLQQNPDLWDSHNLCRLLANDQWQDLRFIPASDTPDNENGSTLLLQALDAPEHWLGLWRNGRLYLLHRRQAVASLVPDLRPPQPRLQQPPAF
ncbi:hypothetical protein [Marinobacterium rhizophilum]|uniref:Uncharacterized protein n=1 Tax=Marinobacterium rhizophilum TaxID=420402 RepID=A0ABY5HMH6_9GAMM|nr:hypothetical protein [Marinobacterium rhizophilum]UTW13605.1 hypothetical protein KDW95_08190 [Marinobacterium rhizophilum]